MKKICFVTGSRAEYGLLKNVIKEVNNSNTLQLQLIVTGMHLCPSYGNSYQEIENDGYKIDYKVFSLLNSDTRTSITKSIGLGIIGFSDAYEVLNPDLLVVLGDRYEIFASAIASLPSGIPVAHIHGGEITEGAFDDAIRHSITKISHFHFVAAKEYKNRVIQMGENPKNVFHVGGLGAENVKKTKFLSKKRIKDELNVDLNLPSFVITFHPVTLEDNTSKNFIKELLYALDSFRDFQLIFTMPNADTDNDIIKQEIDLFVKRNANSTYFTSLGTLKYLSIMSYITMVIGNSSSGLLEAPIFKIPTINLGNRQKGRLRTKSVIDCRTDKKFIKDSINLALSKRFRDSLRSNVSPYEKNGTAKAIIKQIENIDLVKIKKKKFHDIKKVKQM